MKNPLSGGTVHIIGIGGIGMSAIAEIMAARGLSVQGSDQKDGANLRRLAAKGIRVFAGHSADNLAGAATVVISTAVKEGNPELKAAREAGASRVQPRRYARCTDARLPDDLHHRLARQDHHNGHDGLDAGAGGPRSDGSGRRRAPGLGLERAHRQKQVDGGRGRRVGRHLHQAANRNRRGYEHRSGAPRLLRNRGRAS